ncbi:MAG: hypothetical protein ABFC86_04600 [Rectinema sp.]|jgi:hypothetical protein
MPSRRLRDVQHYRHARAVNLADLADNLNALRLKQFDAKAAEQFSKYFAANRFLSHTDSPRSAR